MRIAVTGASGFIGRALTARLALDGHTVVKLSRSAGGRDTVVWDPAAGRLDAAALADCDAVVHLAGESVAGGRWTAAQKQRILSSRETGTRLLATTLAGLDEPRPALVSASAIGYYGNRGEEQLDETSAPGSDFLARVCGVWENACQPAREAGVRVVNPRFGMVLATTGGALPRLLGPLRLGLGGRLGSGRQWVSWVTLDDAVGALVHALVTPGLAGALNVTAPQPVTNAALTAALARRLRRPAGLAVPAFALRLAAGELADGLLLASQRALPRALLASGYAFRHPDLDAALDHLLAAPD